MSDTFIGKCFRDTEDDSSSSVYYVVVEIYNGYADTIRLCRDEDSMYQMNYSISVEDLVDYELIDKEDFLAAFDLFYKSEREYLILDIFK